MSANMQEIMAKRGQKVSVVVNVVERFDGTSIGFPMSIVNGEKEGPKFWLMAGVHGGEVGGIEAAIRLVRDCAPNGMKGTLIVVPIANVTAFEANSRVSPLDGKDLNRSFPGDAEGTFTDRLANKLFTTITSTLTSNDFLVDLHQATGGSSIEFVEYSDEGEDGAKNSELAEASGVKILDRILPEYGWKKAYAGTLGEALKALRLEVPRITIESDDPYLYVLNLLRHVGMISGKTTPPKERFYVDGTRIFASKRGLWIPKQKEEALVRKGQLLATVINLEGEMIEEVRSPFDGIVIIMRGKKVVDPYSGNLFIRYGANVGKITRRVPT
jgi:predicted deacylase